jgi:segregation and condensation protein B
MSLESKIEAILFYKNEPLKIKKLSEILGESESNIKESIKKLSEQLENRGICIIQNDDEVALAVSIQNKDIIDKIALDELSKDIGKAGLETLAIILYKGPISRREIDFIRGVNSTFIIRNLTIRGLVEKDANTENQRVPRYKATINLLAHLGIRNIEELPEFAILNSKAKEVIQEQQKEEELN